MHATGLWEIVHGDVDFNVRFNLFCGIWHNHCHCRRDALASQRASERISYARLLSVVVMFVANVPASEVIYVAVADDTKASLLLRGEKMRRIVRGKSKFC
jgi:hypothetical protein